MPSQIKMLENIQPSQMEIPSQLLLKWSICFTSVETFSDSSQYLFILLNWNTFSAPSQMEYMFYISSYDLLWNWPYPRPTITTEGGFFHQNLVANRTKIQGIQEGLSYSPEFGRRPYQNPGHTSRRSPTKRQVQLLAEQETCTTIIQKGNNYFVSIPEYICNVLYITKLPAMNSSALIGGIFIKKSFTRFAFH